MLRNFLLWMAVVLPSAWKRVYYRSLFGWKIGKGTRIGWSFLDADKVTIGDNVHIGHFNFFKNVQSLEIGGETWISNLNTFSGSYHRDEQWVSTIRIGLRCVVMSRHLFDLGGGIEIGNDVTIAGRESHLWTHTMIYESGLARLVAKPLRVSDGCYIGARSTILFCELPSGTLVGAGSVVTKTFEASEGNLMLAGNPATVKRVYPRELPSTSSDARNRPL